MFRQSPSRNQRSKSFKVRHGLQIFLLLAVCFWLLYQVKHSHDKKKAFDDNSMKLNAKLENDRVLTKLGRKDLHPRVEESLSGGKEKVIEEEEENKPEEEEEDKSEEEDEEDKPDDEEEEENKPEEEEEEEEKDKQEEEEEAEEEENKPEDNEGTRGNGNDEIDEHDQQTTEEETEKEEGFVDEDEKGGKEETEDGQHEEKVQESEKVVSSEAQDRDRNTQEAREENYKGDDASSAVLRETQLLTTANSGDIADKKLVENAEKSKLKLHEANATQNITSAQKSPDQNAEVVEETSVSLKTSEDNRNDASHSQTNSTVTKPDDLPVVSNSSTAESVDTPSSSITLGLTQNKIHGTIDKAENSNITAVTTPTADIAKGELSGTSNKAENVELEEQIGNSNLANNSSSNTNEKTDGTEESNNSEASSTIKGSEDVIKMLTSKATNHTVLNHEEEARTGLGTLPGTESRGTKTEDAATE